MAQQPIKRFIDVEIRKETPRVSTAGFGILLVITDSILLSTSRRVRRFTNVESVTDFFGTGSEEEKVADAYFNQDPFLKNQPTELQFGRFADADTAALIECGDSSETDIEVWKLVTDGEFKVDIDGGTVSLTGLDFSSVTSLDDVAGVIDAALGANGDCYFLINRFNINSPTTGTGSLMTLLSTVAVPAGTDISGSAYLDGDVLKSPTNEGGSILSQGQLAEDFDATITAIENINNTWYAMSGIEKYRDSLEAEDMADEIESREKMFLITTNDSNVLVLGSTSTFSYYLKNKNYKRTATIYHDNDTLYPDMAWLGLELPKPVGSTNWAFKVLPGIAQRASVDITPVNLTEGQKDAAIDVNCNLYSTTLGADHSYLGTMGGGKNADKEGEYIDIIRNIDFMQARIQEGMFSLLLEVDILPMTNAGITMANNRLISLLDTYGVKQGILVEGSVNTSFPKRSEISPTDRDDRLLPDGEFQGELTGGINRIIIRGKVFV